MQKAIEINADAAAELGEVPSGRARHYRVRASTSGHRGSSTSCSIKGVLIHINPRCATEGLRHAARRHGKYLLVCEYYNPSPVSIPYRGHADRLFKRDFCGEILDRHQRSQLERLRILLSARSAFPQDDITWFLMEKRA